MIDLHSAKLLLPTLVDLVEWRAENRGNADAYVFLGDDGVVAEKLSFLTLARNARALAAELSNNHPVGTRALLLYPPGLSFLVAFFGCLYAGLVPVPAYPPRPNRHHARLSALVGDCGARVALTTAEVLSSMQRWGLMSEELAALDWVAWQTQSEPAAVPFIRPAIDADTVAFLQYTSGSTGAPKGVVVTHANLMHNEAAICRAFSHSSRTVFAGWLPLFHDMGLIGNVLQPLYLGVVSVLLPPLAFLQNPVCWLRTISRYRATTSGAPDFAYALCAAKVSDADCEGLDLSSWEVAYNGSEPVRAETLDRFVQRFAPYGFRREAFYPCYGMAESTLFTTGGDALRGASVLAVDSKAFAAKEVRPSAAPDATRLVGCGRAWDGMEIRIVEPSSGQERQPREIGEVWVAGDSVASGYWNDAERSQRTFQARMVGSDRPYLRTGDLGFVDGVQLYITGRQKDLIIIRGKNHYPQDIELTVEGAHSALAQAGGAAFSVDLDGEERLVVVHEVELQQRRTAEPQAVVATIREAIARVHQLRVHRVVLLKPRALPKTSSGKVRRGECKRMFLAGELPEFVASATRPEQSLQHE